MLDDKTLISHMDDKNVHTQIVNERTRTMKQRQKRFELFVLEIQVSNKISRYSQMTQLCALTSFICKKRREQTKKISVKVK